MYDMVVYRRIEHRGWAFGLPPNSDAKMQACRIAVLRNTKNDDRRHLSQWVASMAHEHARATLKDGTVLMPSGEDVNAPAAPELPESQHPRLCSPRKVSANQDSSGDSVAVSNIQTPKRSRTANKDAVFAKRRCATFRSADKAGETTLL